MTKYSQQSNKNCKITKTKRNGLDKKIIKFLKNSHMLSLGVVDDECAYLCSCFYAFDGEQNSIIFASDENTKHIRCGLGKKVGLNIAKSTKIIAKIEGIQATGKLSVANDSQCQIYFKKFRYAKVFMPQIFAVKLEWIKYTSNVAKFANKIIYEFS